VSRKPDITAKIRKLLAKASDAAVSEAEAASFLSAAAVLMEKHNLSRAQIDAGAPGHGYTKGVAHETAGLPLAWVFAMTVVEEACEVEVCAVNERFNGRMTTRFELFGDAANVEAGTLMLRYLAGMFSDLWAAHLASWNVAHEELLLLPFLERIQRVHQTVPRPSEPAYYEGLRTGIMYRLRQEKAARESKRKGGTDLVLSRERLAEAFKTEYPSVVNMVTTDVDAESFNGGIADSARVSLNRKIGPV
jgi:uncharacterized protein DUF2786